MSHTLQPVNSSMFLELVRNHEADGGTVGQYINHIRRAILDSNYRFTGLFIPELKGFLSFDCNSIYEPAGGMSACESIVEGGLVEDSVNYAIKLNDNPVKFNFKK